MPNPALDRGPDDFKHYPLQDWLGTNRINLVWACHVLIQNWIQKGQPWGKAKMLSFDHYAGVIGGIMEAAGIRGFLENVSTYLLGQDEDQGVNAETWRSGCTRSTA